MYKKINNSLELQEEFKKYNRGENFSKKGFALLFNYFEEFEEETYNPFVLDVIEICCAWTETTVDNCLANTGYTLEELEENTIVLKNDNTVVFYYF